MAGFVVLRSGKSWAVANWAFRQFIQDVIAHHAEDKDLAAKLQICEYHQGVHFKRLDASLGKRILLAMRDTAQQTVDNEPGLGVAEPERRQMYTDAVRELLNQLNNELLHSAREGFE